MCSHRREWVVFVRPVDPNQGLEKVVFKLHEDYEPNTVTVTKPPYEVARSGWGEFEVGIEIHRTPSSEASAGPVILKHMLRFDGHGASRTLDLDAPQDTANATPVSQIATPMDIASEVTSTYAFSPPPSCTTASDPLLLHLRPLSLKPAPALGQAAAAAASRCRPKGDRSRRLRP